MKISKSWAKATSPSQGLEKNNLFPNLLKMAAFYLTSIFGHLASSSLIWSLWSVQQNFRDSNHQDAIGLSRRLFLENMLFWLEETKSESEVQIRGDGWTRRKSQLYYKNECSAKIRNKHALFDVYIYYLTFRRILQHHHSLFTCIYINTCSFRAALMSCSAAKRTSAD